jgi:uncharacterized Zn finger protein
MAVRCIECGSRDVESDYLEDDIDGEVYEFECNNCGEIFDTYDLEDAWAAALEEDDC